MRTRKLVAAVALGALLGSDLALAVYPAFGQAPGAGNGQPLMPSLGGGDGGYGRMLPGPGTTAPYAAPQQPPLALPPTQPQIIQRSVGPTPLNVCQPGGRTYQTVSIPRTRPAEPLPPMQQPAGTITQVTVSQSAPGVPPQTGLQPTTEARALSTSAPLAVPELDELSRIEAGFNLDPVRVQQLSSSILVPTQTTYAQQQIQVQGQQLQPASQQRPVSSEGYLGPFGTPLR